MTFDWKFYNIFFYKSQQFSLYGPAKSDSEKKEENPNEASSQQSKAQVWPQHTGTVLPCGRTQAHMRYTGLVPLSLRLVLITPHTESS